MRTLVVYEVVDLWQILEGTMSVRCRVFALAVVAASAGCGTEPPPTPGDTAGAEAASSVPALAAELSEEQAEGRILFQSVCWTCHGATGRGNGPALQSDTAGQPPDFIAEGYATVSTDELLTRFEASLTGDGVDPAHPHMRHVVSVVQPERFRAALSYVPALAYPAAIPGSALAGMELYGTHCVGCHGVNGDGEGYAAEALVMVKPADFRTDSLIVAGDFEGLFNRVREGGRSVHGSAMPPWGVALSDDQMWDLVAYISTFREGTLPGISAGR